MSHLSEEMLNRYLDHELSAAQRGEAENHLAGCAVCRAELKELKSIFDNLAEWSPAPLPFDISQRVMAQLEPVPAKAARFRPLVWVGLAVQVLLTGLIGVWVYPWVGGLGLPVPGSLDFSPVWQTLTSLGNWLDALPGLLPAAADFLPSFTSANIGLAGWVSVVVILGLGWLILNRLLLKGFSQNGNTAKEMAE